MAQFSLYKSKHEFDLNIGGTVCYFFCTLCLTFAKLAGQVFIVMAIQAFFLNSKVLSEGLKSLFFILTYMYIILVHNFKESVINLWMAGKKDSGPYLSVKFVTTTTNTNMFMEKWRFDPEKNPSKCCNKSCPSFGARRDTYSVTPVKNKSCLTVRDQNWSWCCCLIFPFQSIREARHPDVYSFQDE